MPDHTYNEADLVSFGNYVASGERFNSILTTKAANRNAIELPSSVDLTCMIHDADLANWKHQNGMPHNPD